MKVPELRSKKTTPEALTERVLYLYLLWFSILSQVLHTSKLSSLAACHWGWGSYTHSEILLQEGGSLPGPKTGFLSNTRKWIVWGDTYTDKARDFIGKGHPGGEQQGKGTQEDSSVKWLAVSGFMVIGFVPGLFLTNHSNSESFLVVHALFSQDGCQWEGFWEAVGHVVSYSDLSWTLPGGGGLSTFSCCFIHVPPFQLFYLLSLNSSCK